MSRWLCVGTEGPQEEQASLSLAKENPLPPPDPFLGNPKDMDKGKKGAAAFYGSW